MAHPIVEFATEAYAAGVAASGGPVTERVLTGGAVAVALAVEHADDPRVLEVTIDLGRLEGLWARLFRRREDLIRQHADAVMGAWRDLLTAELIADTIRSLRRDDRAPDSARWRQAVSAAAAALIGSLRGSPGWTGLRQSIRDALAAAQAEGAAAAAILAADRAGQKADWESEFETALAAVDGRYQLWADADTWLQRLLDRASDALQRALGDSPDVSDSELADNADQALRDSGDGGPVPFTMDWAMTAAAAAGALAAYTAQGLSRVAWVTAGDGRVCALCESNEAESPYPLIEFPELPAHPRCRCQPVPV